jgi:hypothetical protein
MATGWPMGIESLFATFRFLDKCVRSSGWVELSYRRVF